MTSEQTPPRPPKLARGIRPASAPWYAVMAPYLSEVAHALACHGSMTTDLDLIACPWVEDARPAPMLALRLAEALGAHLDGPESRPHGRLAWSLHFTQTLDGPYVDLSVMPRS